MPPIDLTEPLRETERARRWAHYVLDPLGGGDTAPLLEELRLCLPGSEPRLIGTPSSWIIGALLTGRRHRPPPPVRQAMDLYRGRLLEMSRTVFLARGAGFSINDGDFATWPRALTALVTTSSEAMSLVEGTWLLSQEPRKYPQWSPTWELLKRDFSKNLLQLVIGGAWDFSLAKASCAQPRAGGMPSG